jgi:DNA modification methylase
MHTTPFAKPTVAYRTEFGSMYRSRIESFIESKLCSEYRGKVHLVLTSPPFPLNRKKKYGNLNGQDYVDWLSGLAMPLRKLLHGKGSIVLEMGNAWEPGQPVMSTLALEALLAFLKAGDLKLCQQFICYNPARLPSPAQWVNVERIRLKDSYTHVWWMSPTERPHADNTQVLKPYSNAMLKLLESKKYNSGKRPSEHNIGKTSFLKRNAGAIPANVLSFSNTGNHDVYLRYCRESGIQVHPARMPSGLAEFFIRFLTKEGHLVLDPFAGSNTTGAAAAKFLRKWIAIETDETYIQGSRGRFLSTFGQKTVA